MDHNEAIKLQAAGKYVMGELPPALRDEYEDHYFECEECAADLQATVAFMESSKEVFRNEPQKTFVQATPNGGRGWFAWLKPSVAVPVFAVLVLAWSYQTFVTVPHWKEQLAQSAAPRVLPIYSLITAGSRGAGALDLEVQRGERFGLYVDVPADEAYNSYVLSLKDPAGQMTKLRTLTSEEARKTQVVEVDPGNRPGAYQIVVVGLNSSGSDPAKGAELTTLRFAVSFAK